MQNHFKPKMKSGIEKRMHDVIEVHNLIQENKKTLKRLEQELEQLKPINKPMYLVGKKELARV